MGDETNDAFGRKPSSRSSHTIPAAFIVIMKVKCNLSILVIMLPFVCHSKAIDTNIDSASRQAATSTIAVGASRHSYFGFAVVSIGDVDQDSVDEIAVSSVEEGTCNYGPGRVELLSGIDGSKLWTISGSGRQYCGMGDGFGMSLCASGDLNADGVPDLIVGSPAERNFIGSAFAFSGRDGSQLWKFVGTEDNARFGSTMAMSGDIDLDGVNDAVIGALSGALYFISGRTGNLIRQVRQLGLCSICSVGDMDRDGVADVAVGNVAGQDGGEVIVYSARTGKRIYDSSSDLDGTHSRPSRGFGFDVCSPGDVNRDGVDDLIVISQTGELVLYLDDCSSPPAPVRQLNTLSGKNGSTLWTWKPKPDADWIDPIRSGFDVNQDGAKDVAVTYGRGGERTLVCLDGRDGRVLSEFTIPSICYRSAVSAVCSNRAGVSKLRYFAIADTTWNDLAGRLFKFEINEFGISR